MNDPGFRYFRLVGPGREAYDHWQGQIEEFDDRIKQWQQKFCERDSNYLGSDHSLLGRQVLALKTPPSGLPKGWAEFKGKEGYMVPNKRSKLGRELANRMDKEFVEPGPRLISAIVQEAVGYDPDMVFFTGNRFRTMGIRKIKEDVYVSVAIPLSHVMNTNVETWEQTPKQLVKHNHRPDALEELERWEYFKIVDEEAKEKELVEA